jgi:hypothetical protein
MIRASVMALLAEMPTSQSDRKKNNARDGSSLSHLRHVRRVALRGWLVGISSSMKQKPHPPRSRGCDGSPSLLPRHVEWIDNIAVQAQPSFVVSGVLRSLNG